VMTGDARHCPDPEVLAAFVAGSLSGAELKMTADHVRDCEDCRQILAMTTMVAHNEEAAHTSAPRPRRLRPWWLGVAAASLAGTAYLAIGWWNPLHRLVAAAPHGERYLEPRLSGGFRWAPLRPSSRGGEARPLDAAELKFKGEAGVVLERTKNDPSPQARH